jgi:hypothetical protein
MGSCGESAPPLRFIHSAVVNRRIAASELAGEARLRRRVAESDDGRNRPAEQRVGAGGKHAEQSEAKRSVMGKAYSTRHHVVTGVPGTLNVPDISFFPGWSGKR